jgi:transketolase
MNELPSRSFVLLGDGELQEGSNWEAAMSAARFKLDNLVAIIDRNTLQISGRTEEIIPLEPLAKKLQAFNFDVLETEGNDAEALLGTFESIDYCNGRPHAVIAHTIKGCGVSFMEDNQSWHHRVPVGDELSMALSELNALGGGDVA